MEATRRLTLASPALSLACTGCAVHAQCVGHGDSEAGRDPLSDLPSLHVAGSVLHAMRLADS
jgi:hypothetical protein